MCSATPSRMRAGLDDHIRHRQGALEDAGAVRLGKDRLFERPADLAAVDVEGRHELDVGAAITADRRAHDALERRTLSVAVIFDALHQRAGAVADTGDGHFNFLRHAESVLPSYYRVAKKRRADIRAAATNDRPV